MPHPLRFLPLAVLCLASPARGDLVDFEDLSLPPGSYENGANLSGSFTSGGVEFTNSHTSFVFEGVTYEDWSGFSYSNVNDPATSGFGNQYAAVTGVDRDASGTNYGLGFGYTDLTITDSADLLSENLPWLELPTGATIQGMYVTNTTYVHNSMRDGDGFSKQFGGDSGTDPDFFRLNAYGVDASGALLSSTPEEFYLADYRFSDSSDDYIVDDWSYFDLSNLAGASRVYFDLDSTDVGTFGMNTPAYFAVDGVEFQAAAVPEPGTWALVALAAGAGAFARRRGLGRETKDA